MRQLNSFKKRLLLTGGAGFIGSHVVRHMVNKYPDYLIVNFDALTYAGNLENLKDVEGKENYVFVKGDIRFKTSLIKQVSDKLIGGPKDCSMGVDEVFEKYQITDVIHMAAESHVDKSITSPRIFFETNCLGTENLLDAARDYWAFPNSLDEHKFVSMITDEQFGSLGIDDEPFNEKTPLDPHSPYSASKTCQYLVGKVYHETYDLPIVSLTCGNAIGPNQFPEKLVPLTIDRLINKQPIPIYGEGKQMRDWTNVHDIADAIDLLMHNGTNGELYCIGGDACKTNIDIVKTLIREYAIYETFGHTKKISNLMEADNLIQELNNLITYIPDPRGKAHDFRYDLDHTKITEELGWTPKYTFEDSIKEVVEWYLNNKEWIEHIKNGSYYNRWIEEFYGKK